jgi:hypothetical protein
MRVRVCKSVSRGILLLLVSASAGAQEVAIPGPNMRATLEAIGSAAGSPPLGDALASGTILEIATTPLASGASGLTFVYDPTVGSYTRLAETFGPAFAQRALTSGRGKFTAGLSWSYVKFDQVAGEDIGGFVPFTSGGFLNVVPTKVDLGLDLKTSTVSVFGTVGLTNRIDVGIVLPITSVSLRSDLAQTFPLGPVQTATSDQSATGLADMLVQGKVQLWRSERTAGNSGAPAAAVAAVAGVRLPTGSEEDLRGLGFARTKLSAVLSTQASRFAAHANVGYEFWANQLTFARDLLETSFAETNGLVEMNLAAELAVAPKVTVNVDFLLQEIRGAGKLGNDTLTLAPFPGFPGLTAQSLVGLDQGLVKATLVPGVRWNLGGNALLNAHVLLNMKNDGLRAKVTPVIGFDYTF